MYTSQERQWAMLSHLITMILNLTTGFGWLVGFIIFALNPPKSKFVAFHALQTSLFQLAMAVIAWVSVCFFWLIIPIFFAILAWFACLVYPIMGAIKANNGEEWRYPFVGNFAYRSTMEG